MSKKFLIILGVVATHYQLHFRHAIVTHALPIQK